MLDLLPPAFVAIFVLLAIGWIVARGRAPEAVPSARAHRQYEALQTPLT